MKKSLVFLISVCGLCLLSACGGGSTPPPPATHFSLTAPGTATAGTAFSITVTALDASNNVATSYSGIVHYTSSDAQATLPANSTLTNGVGNLSVTLKTAGDQTITATDTTTSAITGSSSSIVVSAGAATHFSVTAPAAATAGTAFSISVTALDASNSTVASYAGTVHFTSTDGQAVLPANSTLANGTGTFSATLKTDGGQTITATDTVVLTITGVSDAIQVSSTAPVGTFTSTGSMEFARAGHTATLLQNGTVLIAGGENSTGPLASAEIYNPATGMFASSGSMGTARVGHTATLLINGYVLVTGGNNATGALATAEVFDPSTGSFSPTTGNMETARVGHTATLLHDGTGRVLVAGGGTSPEVLFGPVADPGTATAELFDPNSGQFTAATNNMLASRIYHTATLLPSGEVLLAGGTNSGSALGDLFSPANAMFTATTTGGTTALHLAALLTDGYVLLTGGELLGSPCGEGGNWVSIDNALIFNDGDASFKATVGEMSALRVTHTATLVTGGEVLIAGGATSQTSCNRGFGTSTFQSVASAELFHAAAETFTPTGSMETARAAHTATLLGNGNALLVGGVDSNGNFLATAELFQ
jgi:Galactose oxidase, central domain